MEEHNGAGKLTPDEAVEQARQEAEAKGETLSRVDEAKIRAKATVSQQSADEEAVTEEEAAKVLGIKHSIFGYPTKNWSARQQGKRYSHMCSVRMISAVISWSALWLVPVYPSS